MQKVQDQCMFANRIKTYDRKYAKTHLYGAFVCVKCCHQMSYVSSYEVTCLHFR